MRYSRNILCVSFALLSLLFLSCGGGKLDRKEKELKFNPRVKFFEDYLNFASNEAGKTRLDVFIQVPYSELQFVKANLGFEAKYNLTVSIFDEAKKNLLVEKTWLEKITAKDFDQTISKNNFNLSLRSFNLVPGKYFIRTSFEDAESRQEFVTENEVKIRELKKSFSVSDIMLISKQTVVDGSNKIIPNVSRNVAAKKDGIPVFYEIYSTDSRDLKIEYSLVDNEKLKVFSEVIDKSIDSGKTQIFHTIKDIELGLGNYLFTIELKESKSELTISTGKYFVSRWVGVPGSIRDLDKAIAQMVYIATSSELDEIQNAPTQEEKIKRYLDYWKKKDPDPRTEDNPVFDEYYRRVAFANENFSHYIEGWRTDRGMVYIILGAPNNINRHPFEYDSKPYEVWEYYELNKSFIFLDETGFGDYRLITPLYGDFFRYRN